MHSIEHWTPNRTCFGFIHIEWETDRRLNHFKSDGFAFILLYLVFQILITSNASIDYPDGILIISEWKDRFSTIKSLFFIMTHLKKSETTFEWHTS